MRIIRYEDQKGNVNYASQNEDGNLLQITGNIFGDYSVTNSKAEVNKILAPLIPSSIFCIGLNYKFHAEESGAKIPEKPVLFMKGLNAVQNPGDPIYIPKFLKSEEVDYEAELVVVIGKKCKNVLKENALDYVLGYMCGNDVSARDWQIKWGGGQWCRGKTFDTFAPLGPAIVTKDEIPEPNNLKIQTILNRKTVQDWNTNDMIFNVPEIIEFLSGSTTLLPGTIIMTGTPHGVGMAQKPPLWLKDNDEVTIKIEKIGELSNTIRNESV